MDDERLKRAGGGQLLRGTARPHPRHPLVRAGVLAEGPRHLRHQHRLRPERRGIPALLQDRAEQDALGGARPYRGRGHPPARRRIAAQHGSHFLDRLIGLRKTDVAIAKNYLNARRSTALNASSPRTSNSPSCRPCNRRPMHMADWIAKLDDFLRLSDRDILTHAGKISHEQAVEKAEIEFEKYRQTQAALPQPVDHHFEQTLDELKRIEHQKKPKPKKKRRRSRRRRNPSRQLPRRKAMSSTTNTSDWLPPTWRLARIDGCMSAIIDYRGKSPEKTKWGVPLITAKIVKGGRMGKPTSDCPRGVRRMDEARAAAGWRRGYYNRSTTWGVGSSTTVVSL